MWPSTCLIWQNNGMLKVLTGQSWEKMVGVFFVASMRGHPQGDLGFGSRTWNRQFEAQSLIFTIFSTFMGFLSATKHIIWKPKLLSSAVWMLPVIIKQRMCALPQWCVIKQQNSQLSKDFLIRLKIEFFLLTSDAKVDKCFLTCFCHFAGHLLKNKRNFAPVFLVQVIQHFKDISPEVQMFINANNLTFAFKRVVWISCHKYAINHFVSCSVTSN